MPEGTLDPSTLPVWPAEQPLPRAWAMRSLSALERERGEVSAPAGVDLDAPEHAWRQTYFDVRMTMASMAQGWSGHALGADLMLEECDDAGRQRRAALVEDGEHTVALAIEICGVRQLPDGSPLLEVQWMRNTRKAVQADSATEAAVCAVVTRFIEENPAGLPQLRATILEINVLERVLRVNGARLDAPYVRGRRAGEGGRTCEGALAVSFLVPLDAAGEAAAAHIGHKYVRAGCDAVAPASSGGATAGQYLEVYLSMRAASATPTSASAEAAGTAARKKFIVKLQLPFAGSSKNPIRYPLITPAGEPAEGACIMCYDCKRRLQVQITPRHLKGGAADLSKLEALINSDTHFHGLKAFANAHVQGETLYIDLGALAPWQQW